MVNSSVVRPSRQLLSRMHLYLTYFQVVWTSLFRNSRNFCHLRHKAELSLHFHWKGSGEFTGNATCFYSYLIFTGSYTLISFFSSSFLTYIIFRVNFRENRFGVITMIFFTWLGVIIALVFSKGLILPIWVIVPTFNRQRHRRSHHSTTLFRWDFCLNYGCYEWESRSPYCLHRRYIPFSSIHAPLRVPCSVILHSVA